MHSSRKARHQTRSAGKDAFTNIQVEYTGLDRFPTILARVVTDVDSRTMTLKFTIRGPNINYAELRKAMADSSVAVKGVDEITVSKMRTPTKT